MIDTEDRGIDSKRRKHGDGGTGKERRGVSANDKATERFKIDSSFSVPEQNKEVDKVIQKETKRE